MQVAHGCRCRGILGCGVAGAATQNRSQVMLWQSATKHSQLFF